MSDEAGWVKAAKRGLSPDMVERQLKAIFFGQVATQVRESALRITDIRVRYPDAFRFGRSGFTNWIPFTLERRPIGLEKNGSLISDILASRKARNVVHPLWRPTLCRNSAQGNACTLTTSCRNSTSSKVFARTLLTSAVCLIAVRFSRMW